MRVLLITFFGFMFLQSCKTPQGEDKRFFAAGQASDGEAGATSNISAPQPKPSMPLPPLIGGPKETDLEKGAFYVICQAQTQLTGPQILTLKALRAATHQQDCLASERYLRDERNKRLMIESEELVELNLLSLLKAYPHIKHISIKVAKGVDRVCPLPSEQTCHFIDPDPSFIPVNE